MSQKYAVIVSSDGGMTPGVNALLNGFKYYGMEDKVEFHLLYWRGEQIESFIKDVQDDGFYPKFVPVDLIGYCEGIEGKLKQTARYYLTAYRYHYCASLRDYDAVMMIDADAAVVNNLMWFFDIVAKTDFIILPNNNGSGEEYDTCVLTPYQSEAAPPLHCHPLFFRPALYGDVFSEIPKLCTEVPMGDMACCSYVLTKHNLMNTKVFVQSNLFWVNTALERVQITEQFINDKRFLVTCTGDRAYAVHGRWWFAFNMEKFTVEPESPKDKIRNWNIRRVWETYYFFNHNCYHGIEWDIENWGEPSMWSSIGSGNRW